MAALSDGSHSGRQHVPNVLSWLRIAAIPAYVWCALSETSGRWAAVVVFVLAMLTDAADGWLARRWQVESRLGQLLDPIADKAMTGAALVTLAVLDVVAWAAALIIISREVLVTVMRLWVADEVVIPAAWAGKVKTGCQSVALFMLTAPLTGWWAITGQAILWVAVALTVWSGALFVIGWFRVRRVRDMNRLAAKPNP